MPRIEYDPAREVCPDFTLPMFRVVRASLIAYPDAPLLRTDGEAARALVDAWQEYNRQRRKEYKQQEEEEWALKRKRNPFRRPPSPAPLRLILDLTDEPPNKKRKPLPIIDRDRGPPDFIWPRPLRFAIKKIEKYQWVELWYFSREGCAEAKRTPSCDELFEMVTTVDGRPAFRLIPPFAASENVIPDAQLAWPDFIDATQNYLASLSNANWPQEVVTSMKTFFDHIAIHRLGSSELGRRALLTYQARVRREWHIQSEESDEIAFDISNINSSLLSDIMHQLRSDQLDEQLETLQQGLEELEDRRSQQQQQRRRGRQRRR
ncbi:hypothetical protein BD779DRAFT_97799 [Infundibulicybe gibba]|nr:hypothetical protein BD779DRAFT_97799 [Infundibulicybe gibba]